MTCHKIFFCDRQNCFFNGALQRSVKGRCQALSIFTWNFEQCFCLNSELTTIIYTKGSAIYSNMAIENRPPIPYFPL